MDFLTTKRIFYENVSPNSPGPAIYNITKNLGKNYNSLNK